MMIPLHLKGGHHVSWVDNGYRGETELLLLNDG